MRAKKLATGLALGAATMFLLDPDHGARRRGQARDQTLKLSRNLRRGAGITARDLRNRWTGAGADLSSRFRRDDAGDEVIHERIRAALGRAVSHPGSIDVAVFEGRAILSGHVLADELADLLRTVRRVRGVREVENQLQIHQRAEQEPALQGEGKPRRSPLNRNWSPTSRLLLGLAGGLATLRGLRSRGVLGKSLTTLGAGLLARVFRNPGRAQDGAHSDARTMGQPSDRELAGVKGER
jgi:hypothetical protein